MRALPLSIGTIHFVGIGGIGMSGIAEVLHTLGYRVQGSDIADSANVRRLREAGIPVAIGHDAAHLGDAQVVVVSTAVKRDNPEVLAARARFIPVVRRAEMLAELMRLKWSIAVGGTHGKTTTTSLIAAVLEAAKLDPTVINGGIINAYGSNTRMGAGEWMVVEADESDGSFLRLPAVIAVVTNMDPEHLDHWGTGEAMVAGYDQFVANIPFYGFAVLCIDHPAVQQMIPRLSDRRIITYGFSPQADVRAEQLRTDRMGATFHVTVTDRIRNRTRQMGPFRLPMLGQHNVQNALAAAAVCIAAGARPAAIERGLAEFRGMEHRLELVRERGGVQFYNDSKATTPESAIAALDAFDGRPVIIIAGGYDKHVPLDAFARRVFEKARTAILLGETADALARHLEEYSRDGFRWLRVNSLDDAVSKAAAGARPGDVVLLSPACASYDMFSNYEERGSKFKELCMRL